MRFWREQRSSSPAIPVEIHFRDSFIKRYGPTNIEIRTGLERTLRLMHVRGKDTHVFVVPVHAHIPAPIQGEEQHVSAYLPLLPETPDRLLLQVDGLGWVEVATPSPDGPALSIDALPVDA